MKPIEVLLNAFSFFFFFFFFDLKKKEKWCVHVGTGKPRKPPGTAALLARGWITGGGGTRT